MMTLPPLDQNQMRADVESEQSESARSEPARSERQLCLMERSTVAVADVQQTRQLLCRCQSSRLDKLA